MLEGWIVPGGIAVVLLLLGRAFWLYLSRDDSQAEEQERKDREERDG